MKRFITTTMAVGLLFAAASCSSDSKSTSTTKAGTDVTTAVSTDAPTGVSTADSTASTGAATPGSVDVSGLDAARAQAVTQGIASAAASGVTLDPTCFINIVKQLSDADVKLINAAGPNASPTLSSNGEVLGAKVTSTCVVAP